MFKHCALFVLLVQLIDRSAAVVRFENLKYELNKDYMHGNIFIKSQNDKYSFGADVELAKKIDGSVIVTPHVQHLIKGEYHTMVNIDLDTCKGRYLLNDFTLDSESPLLKLIPNGKYRMQLKATHHPTPDATPTMLFEYSVDFELFAATR
uniref:Uncharacterized protein n=1 Tax=Anopheles maculatus TaxID=74869 RepID=A0A182T333_9DIPT